MNRQIGWLIVLLWLGMARLQAQCSALEQKLNKRALPDQISVWKATLIPLTEDKFELIVQVTILKELQLGINYHQFNFSHYGFEVLNREEYISRVKDQVTILRFFSPQKKKGTVLVEKIQLRKTKDAPIYLIQGTGSSNVFYYEDRIGACGCTINYTSPFELLTEDPAPKTLILDNNIGYITKKSKRVIACKKAE
ncbi:MAG: hypothetical protein AB8E82_00905 [Aureispira sp.]